MKNNRLFRNLVVITAIFWVVGCNKTNEPAPITQCYLTSITDATGKATEKCTYNASNMLLAASYEDIAMTFDFTYTAQGLVDKVTVTDKSNSKPIVFVVTYSYDATNKATKAITAYNGKPYQTNEISYNATNQAVKIVTTDANANVLVTRLEYLGENVAKVFQKFDDEKEYLYYEITKFDDKKNIYPDAYKALFVGLAGLIDGAPFLNKNNAIEDKYYDDLGVAYYSEQRSFEYNSTLYPTKITSNINDDGDKSTEVSTYVYNCK
jgi:hypothetical protein